MDCLNGPSYLTKHISRAFGCFARSEMPREPVPSSIADANRVFGEPLPDGLRWGSLEG